MWGVGKLTAELDATVACEATAMGNLSAAWVVCDTISCDPTTIRRLVNRMQAALINLRTDAGNFFDALNLCCSTIRSAVNSRVGTFMSTLWEASHEKLMFLHRHIDCNVNSTIAAVHRQLHLPDSVNAGHARTQVLAVTDLQ